MALTATQVASLGNELHTDPAAIGYSPHIASGDDAGLAMLLNAPRAGQTCQSGPLTPQQVLAAITITDLAAGQDVALLAWINQINDMPVGLDLNNAKVAAVFTRFFASGTASFNALAALMQVSGCSRAQALFGVATTIVQSDVSQSLGRGK
jgi:hypothetical protein